MTLQEAFNKLFEISNQACDADIELEEQELNDVMVELWSVLRKTHKFYTGTTEAGMEWLKK